MRFRLRPNTSVNNTRPRDGGRATAGSWGNSAAVRPAGGGTVARGARRRSSVTSFGGGCDSEETSGSAISPTEPGMLLPHPGGYCPARLSASAPSDSTWRGYCQVNL
jgi:hypothetical protein